MSTDTSSFTQTRLARVLKGAAKAGHPASRVVVHGDGRIELVYDDRSSVAADATTDPNEWDSVK